MANSKKRNMTIAAIAVIVIVIAAAIFFISGNKSDDDAFAAADTVNVPQFNADSAYNSIVAQCAFGPRVPNTEAQRKCSDYIVHALEKCGLIVSRQRTTVTAYDGTSLRCVNIFATTDTLSTKRILITAHWDSRPWADQDPDEANHKTPVLAANDGASGVAVIIELARNVMLQKPNVAVDFALFDAEDYGVPEWDKSGNEDKDATSWCLGTQYFAANLPNPDYHPVYAINLDMVGGKGARFFQEGFSKRFAQGVVNKVWAAAAQAGYGSTFVNQDGGYVTDDHLPLNEIAMIPTIDIIPFYQGFSNSFGPTWHTVSDTPENIDRNTLKAVGQTMLQLIYNEK